MNSSVDISLSVLKVLASSRFVNKLEVISHCLGLESHLSLTQFIEWICRLVICERFANNHNRPSSMAFLLKNCLIFGQFL